MIGQRLHAPESTSSTTNGTETIQCPLCQEFTPASEIQRHYKAESDTLREYTINLIKSRHQNWVKEDGTCPKCWEHYKAL